MVFVVERYLPGLSRSDLLRGLCRLEQTVAGERGEVRYLGSTIVLEDEACFCQFEGPSEAAIAEANRRAGLPFDRIVPAVTVQSDERRSPMQVSTHPLPATVQLGRTRLFGLIAAVAAVVAVGSWAIVAYAVSSGGSSTAMTRQERQYVESITALTPAQLQAAFGTGSVSISPEAQHIQAILSMTPVQLVAAFGTDSRAAAALSTLTPKERLYVETIMSLTPAQLRAAFGTSVTPIDALGLTPQEKQHVQAITSLTPEQLVAAFGTNSAAAAVLSALTPKERQYVESIMAISPAQLRAAFGTGR
jgi:uncharacterized protein DUF4242